ncbi:MAG: hypothetical protein LQ346_001370 [Caloplaca aetnensis]|nr:MAG: hypothetical protein LQ346_001370 [Caloplaca aetnensis]
MNLLEKISRWQPELANGENIPKFYPDTASVGSREGNLPTSAAKDPPGDAQAHSNPWEDTGEFGDIAAFTATAHDLTGTQKRVSFSQFLAEYSDESLAYPPLDELEFLDQPYFGDSRQIGHYGVFPSNEAIQNPVLDGNFPTPLHSAEHEAIWSELLTGDPQGQFNLDQAWQQAMASSDEIWNARPALHDLPSPEIEHFGLQPPPLPLHSKPGRPSPTPEPKAPVANMVLPAISSPRSGSGSQYLPTESQMDDYCIDPALASTQGTRKRKAPASTFEDSALWKTKAPTIPLHESDDEMPVLSVRDKKQRIQEASIKMAYVQGSFRHVQPGQRLNPRTKAIQQTEELNKKYEHVPPTRPWSTFKYSATGELNIGDLLTPSDIQRYLYEHPLHNLPSGVHDKKNSGLRLWIQRNPADSARRYPSHQANRCRFTECLATNNVINQGHLRVCFDEQTHLRLNNNPFFAAAYVHLNCLERFLDFPAICRDLNISPENRNLPHEPRGRNRMMLSPDSSTHIAYSFIRKCENGMLNGYPRGARPHEGTLVWQLMSNKVAEESHIFRRQEAKRGDAKASRVNVHLGDLELEAQNRDKTRRVKYQVDRKGPATKKRKAKDESESESEGDSEEEVKTKPRRKYTKRSRA